MDEAAKTPIPTPDATAPARPDDRGGDAATGGEGDLEARIVAALKTVYDPEIPVDIYELGLIYDVQVGDDGAVAVKMTLTSPACPVAGSLPGEVEATVRDVEGVSGAEVELVWDPAWSPAMMSEAAKLELGMF